MLNRLVTVLFPPVIQRPKLARDSVVISPQNASIDGGTKNGTFVMSDFLRQRILWPYFTVFRVPAFPAGFFFRVCFFGEIRFSVFGDR